MKVSSVAFAAVLAVSAGVAGAQETKWEKLGEPGELKDSTRFAVLDGKVYTVDGADTLHATGADGKTATVGGKGAWLFVETLTAHDGALFAIVRKGKRGTLYRTDGTAKTALGKEGDWGGVRQFVSGEGALFAIEETGELHRVDAKTAAYERIGTGTELAGTRLAAIAGGSLFVVSRAGTLAKVDLKTGAREEVGKAGACESLKGLAGAGAALYGIDAAGTLLKASAAGEWEKIAQGGPADAIGLVAAGGALFALDGAGHLAKATAGSTDAAKPEEAKPDGDSSGMPGAIETPVHQWKGCGVGSSVKFKMVSEAGGTKTEMTLAYELTKTSDKAYSVKMIMEMANGFKQETPMSFVVKEPPGGADKEGPKAQETGKEKLIVGGTELECTWTRNEGNGVVSKSWTCEKVPGLLVKSDSEGPSFKSSLELVAFEKK